MKAGHDQSPIAQLIGVLKPTISREIRRNRGRRGYRPKQAHEFALSRQLNRATARISDRTWRTTKRLLRED